MKVVHMLPSEITQQLDKIIKDPTQRMETFFNLGQSYLLPLNERALQEAVVQMWQYCCDNEKDWVGGLMVPELYRVYKNENRPKDIYYTIKDFFMWCVLYPKEVEQYFIQYPDGKLETKTNPVIRLISRDTTKDVYKSELGKMMLVPVKVALSTKLSSQTGFTVGQKNDIVDACLVGLLQKPMTIKKPEVEVKKSTPKRKKKNETIETNTQ